MEPGQASPLISTIFPSSNSGPGQSPGPCFMIAIRLFIPALFQDACFPAPLRCNEDKRLTKKALAPADAFRAEPDHTVLAQSVICE